MTTQKKISGKNRPYIQIFEENLKKWRKVIQKQNGANIMDPKEVQNMALMAINMSESNMNPDELEEDMQKNVITEAKTREHNRQEIEKFIIKYGTFKTLPTNSLYTQKLITEKTLQAMIKGNNYETWSRSTGSERVKMIENMPALNRNQIYQAFAVSEIGAIESAMLMTLSNMYPESREEERESPFLELAKKMKPLERTSKKKRGGVKNRRQEQEEYQKMIAKMTQEKTEERAKAVLQEYQSKRRGKKGSKVSRAFKKILFTSAGFGSAGIGAWMFFS